MTIERLKKGCLFAVFFLCVSCIDTKDGTKEDTSNAPIIEANFPELQWLHPSTSRLQHLAASPAECLDVSGSSEQLYQIEVGRQAFRSPALLGGQGARVGLSCQGCHINGHDHPAFYIEGISEGAGTVDVTTAVFSEVRGDGIHNPVVIPSLVNIVNKQSFGTLAPQSSLTHFVQGLIVEEFAGEEPAPQLLSALASYLQALSTSACPMQTSSVNTLDLQLFNIIRSIDVIDQASQQEGDIVLDFLILSAQHELSVLYQRFATDRTGELAQQIIDFSRQLGALRSTPMNAKEISFHHALKAWLLNWQTFSKELQLKAGQSLYERQVLEDWLLARP